MVYISVDFKKTKGVIKDVNGTNNGPAGSSVRKNSVFDLYKDLEIPYARLHDSSFYPDCGGEDSVDVHRIFKNFDADENDPTSYLFGPTDGYIASIVASGTKPFYRLGASIEHYRKVGTYPPKDFAKWARICEHIIRHYTEGWADGFNYDIEYWEIWNEPECKNADGSNPCWQGTEEEFVDFYEVVAKHLKACFPNLKIGGPGFAGNWPQPIYYKFLEAVRDRNIPLDFYTFHLYLKHPTKINVEVKRLLERFEEVGVEPVEIMIDEWNYVRGWAGDVYKYSMHTINSLKGSALVAGAFICGQAGPVSKLMYYDAHPCAWCGLYDQFLTQQKTYYVFKMFNQFKKLGNYVVSDQYKQDNIYYCCASKDDVNGIFITNYSEHDNAPARNVSIDLTSLKGKWGANVKFYQVDEEHNGELVYEEQYEEWEDKIEFTMPLFATYYIEITPNE